MNSAEIHVKLQEGYEDIAMQLQVSNVKIRRILVNTLKQGDTIGIISPSWVADKDDYEKYAKGIERLGFQIKFGKNIFKDTYKYTASVEERVDDLNEMVYDENVKMVFFGGGYGSVDLLPYIDYKKIKETSKIFLSYSDGTSILNAIYAQTSITTYYGQTPGLFDNISEYDRRQFVSHLVDFPHTKQTKNTYYLLRNWINFSLFKMSVCF